MRCCSRAHERSGVKNKWQEKCAFFIREHHLTGQGVGFDHDAGTIVTRSDRVDPHRSRKRERRLVTDCQSICAGFDGSCLQCDTSWPAVYETPTVVAKDQGVLPEWKPTSHDQGHAVIPMCLGHVEKPPRRSAFAPRANSFR